MKRKIKGHGNIIKIQVQREKVKILKDKITIVKYIIFVKNCDYSRLSDNSFRFCLRRGTFDLDECKFRDEKNTYNILCKFP